MINKGMDTVRSTDLGLLALYGKRILYQLLCYLLRICGKHIYIEGLGISEGNYVTI